MKRKEIVLGVIGVVVIIVVAFFIASLIHENHVKSLSKESNLKENKEEKIEVDGNEVLFKTYKVDGVFFINIPDNFIKLSEDELKAKYNYNERPELVFMSELDSEHVFISTTDQDMTDDMLESYLNERVAALSNMTVLDNKVYTKYNKTFARLVATDANTYYNMRFFTLDNKLVTVEFNCSVNTYEEWEKVANEIMDSLCFNEDDIKKYSND